MADFLDFDDIKIKPKFREKYKGVKDEKHRIAVIWPKPVEGEKKGPFVLKQTHYEQKYFFCKDGICCEKLGPSKTRLACLVVKYKTKKDGTILKKEGETIPFDYEVLEWVFTENKYNQLKSLHSEWDLKMHDLMVTCSGDEKFQDLEFVPCKESIWQLKPEFKEAIYKESESVRANLQQALGQDLSIDEIKELLGVGGGVPASAISNEADLNSVLDEV